MGGVGVPKVRSGQPVVDGGRWGAGAGGGGRGVDHDRGTKADHQPELPPRIFIERRGELW